MRYSRFTDRARKVMKLANREAQRLNLEYIGTEHILLGLVKEGSGVAANALKNLGIRLPKIRREVEKIVQHGLGGEQVVMGRLPHTPQARKAIDYSIEEARNLNHNYVGTEHLLLGVLREAEGVAAQVLINLGVRLEDVRAGVLNLLAGSVPSGHSPAQDDNSPAPPARTDPLPSSPPGILWALRSVIEELTTQRDAFVAAQDFEAAAGCRDKLDALRELLAWCESLRSDR